MILEVASSSMDEFFPGVFAIGTSARLRPPQEESGLLDWRLGGALSSMVRDGIFAGREDDKVLFWSQRRCSKIYFFGTGMASTLTGSSVTNCVQTMVKVLLNAGELEVTLLAQRILGTEENVERALAFLAGLVTGAKFQPERFGKFRLSIAADGKAENYHEALRKALLRRGGDAGEVELTFTEKPEGNAA